MYPKFLSKGSLDNKPALDEVIAKHQTGQSVAIM